MGPILIIAVLGGLAVFAYFYGLLPAPTVPDANSEVFTQIENIPAIYIQWAFCLLAAFVIMLWWKKPAIKYSAMAIVFMFIFMRYIQPNI